MWPVAGAARLTAGARGPAFGAWTPHREIGRYLTIAAPTFECPGRGAPAL